MFSVEYHYFHYIGVTLARIDSIDKSKRLVRLSACDLVHGTPVLDIKPYVPFYDSMLCFYLMQQCNFFADTNYHAGIPDSYVATWINETIQTRNNVTISAEARKNLENFGIYYFYSMPM